MLSVTCLSLLVSFRQRQEGLQTPRLTGVLPPAMSNAAVGGPLEFGFAWVCDCGRARPEPGGPDDMVSTVGGGKGRAQLAEGGAHRAIVGISCLAATGLP